MLNPSIQKTYQTMLNYLKLVGYEEDVPSSKSFRSDAEWLDTMAKIYQSLLKGLQEEASVSKHLKDSMTELQSTVLKNHKARKAEIQAYEIQMKDIDKRKYNLKKEFGSDSDAHDGSTQVSVKEIKELENRLSKWNKKLQEIKLVQNDVVKKEAVVKKTENDSKSNKLWYEEIKNLEIRNEELRMQLRNLEIKSQEMNNCEEDFVNNQNVLSSQKDYWRRELKKMKKKNEKNFLKYTELMEIQEFLSKDWYDIDEEMNKLRYENREMQEETENLESWAKGLDEQEELNQILEEKLASFTNKLKHMGEIENDENDDMENDRVYVDTGDRDDQEEVYHIDLAKEEGQNYTLGESIKIDINLPKYIQNRNSIMEPSNMNNISQNRSISKSINKSIHKSHRTSKSNVKIHKNQNLIKDLEDHAEEIDERLSILKMKNSTSVEGKRLREEIEAAQNSNNLMKASTSATIFPATIKLKSL